jgi:stage V sporulation protein D (sporulation-specific penicillin-binding protein)
VNISPLPGSKVKEGNKILLYTRTTPTYNKIVVMPDLKGYGKEKAEKVLESFGLYGDFIGEGIVTEQAVPEGKTVSEGTSISTLLEESDD